MATIQDYLNNILKAVYGKDVRQSIHDAIKQCYTDAAGEQKVDKNQGKNNSGKVLGIGTDGLVYPTETGAGLTITQINALDGMFKKVAFSEDPTSAYTAFKMAFGIGGMEDTGGTEWTDGVPYKYTIVENEYVSTKGLISYNGWSRTPYLPCKGVSSLTVTYIDSSSNTLYGAYAAWYDAGKNMINSFNQTIQNFNSVPSNACYFILSQDNKVMANIASITPNA